MPSVYGISAPVARLMHSVEELPLEDEIALPVPDASLDESYVTGQDLELMVDKTHELMTQIYQNQRLCNTLQFRVMQAQIKPHFLYNALETAASLCTLGMAQDAAAPIMEQCGALLAQIQSSLFSVVFAALGTPQRTFTEIPLSYRAAKLALGDHLLHLERQQFSAQAGSNAEDLFSQPMRAQLQQALLYHDKHLLQYVLRSLFLSFQSQPCTFSAIRRSCLSMLSCMSAFLQRQFPAQAMSVLKIGEFLEQAVYLASLEELEQRMTEQVIAVLSSYRHSIQAENPSRIEQIRTYILENLSDTALSIESVSKRFYISYHYLCSFFKKQEGISLGEYIVDRRMERAKELIVSGVTNVTLLSASVGFSDPNYFSRCFKKRFSCSPSKYIESHVPAGPP